MCVVFLLVHWDSVVHFIVVFLSLVTAVQSQTIFVQVFDGGDHIPFVFVTVQGEKMNGAEFWGLSGEKQ
jgi:hypothetical protein